MHRLSRILAFPLLFALLLACAPQAQPPAAPTAPATASAPSTATTTAPTTQPSAPATATVQPSTSAAAPSGQSVELIVFAAASLTDSFKAIGTNFETATPGTKVTFSFAGSQQLAQQIGQGAPADVFASANGAQMDVVVKSGQVAAGAAKTFARNHLVVIVPANNPAKLTTLADLAKPGLKIVLEDKSVPAGQYSLDFLDKASKDPAFGASYKDNVLKNVVSYEQDVKSVLTKISVAEGDAGIVYTTDVTPAAADKVGRIAIPDALNTIATYPIAPIKDSKHGDLAQKFVDYVLGADGQAVMATWGFIPPAAPAASSAPTGSVALTGLVNTPTQLTASDLQKLPSEMVSVTFQGPKGAENHTFRGVRLASVISQAGLKLDTTRKNDQLRKYIVFTANDGYEAVLGWGEIDPTLGNAPILLAWEQDGQPLTGQNGPLRLVVPGDAHGARYVTGLVRMEVRDVDSPARAK